jgi:hypothetical protein
MPIGTLPSAPTPILATTSTRLDALRPRLAGRLITPDSPDYDDARRILNVTVDRRPLAIVRAANAEDVAAAVTCARDNRLPLAVRSGGHSIAYLSVIDGALVVDLSTMKRVAIEPEARIARVQAGATSGDLAGPANAHGLALSTGDTHSVGMGGLTTGGGIGFMVRKYGLAIDNLLSAEVVTAAGEIVTASPFEHPDLFWAIRGGAARHPRSPPRLPRLHRLGARRPDDDRQPDARAALPPRSPGARRRDGPLDPRLLDRLHR